MTPSDLSGYRLCFVDESVWAYFASVPPTEMSGDDWNDAPHDCNASRPYPSEGQHVFKVAYTGDLTIQGFGLSGMHNDGYLSADDINRGAAPWLVNPGFGTTYPMPAAEVWAGTTFADFVEAVRAADGDVYLPARLTEEADRG